MCVNKKIIICLVVILSGVFFVFSIARADNNIKNAMSVLDSNIKNSTNITGTKIPTDDLSTVAGFWIKIALGMVGIVFFILIFYAAFNWMVSQGEEDKIKSSKNTIMASIIGLMIVVSSYAITNIVIKNLVEQKNSIGSVTDGPKGCCVDWVKTDALQIGIPACRITTYEDCNFQGSNYTNTDVQYGPEGKGNWTWDGGVTEISICNQSCGG